MNRLDLPAWLEEEPAETPRPLPLLAFVLVLAASGSFLYAISGPPHAPASFPSWTDVLFVLQGTDVPLEAFAYFFTTGAWLLWIWIVASLFLRALAVSAEAVSRGAAWAASLRAATDRFTLPIVRKVVDGAVVAVIVINLVGRAPAASAAPLDYPAVTIARTLPRHPDSPPATAPTSRHDDSDVAGYTVKPGDTLWAIAQHFYGTGEEFPRLVDANAGRRMPDGKVFTRAGVIQPGWVLRVPLPSRATQTHAGQSYYIVEKGDTLRGIAARFLGDENRWPAIFDLNRGTARLPDGRVLKDPDLIWPGLRLRLAETPPVTTNPPPPAAPATRPAPIPAVEPPSPTVRPTPVLTARPSPRPVPSTPTVVATATPAPTRTPAPAPSRTTSSTTSIETFAAVGLAAAVLGGGLWLARNGVRRRLSESLPLVTPSERPPCDNFAEAEFARTLAYHLQSGDVEPVTAVAARLLHLLGEHAIDDVAILLADQSQTETTLVLRASLRDQEELEDLAGELGASLGGKVMVRTTPDHDALVRLTGTRLSAIVGTRPDRVPDSLGLVPLGLLPGGATVFANWRGLGNVLVTGLPGGGVEIVLTSLLCALAARYQPAELRVWTIANARGLPPSLAHLPHQVEGLVDPSAEGDVARVLDGVRAELLRRMARGDRDPDEPWRPSPDEPEIVLLAGALDDLIDDGTTLELIGTHGPAHGVRLVAGCSRGDGIRDELLPHFRTRLVLQTVDDDESILLLGTPAAAELGSAEFLLRAVGRNPLRLRGFRVSDAHLSELIRLMDELSARPRARSEVPPIEPGSVATAGQAATGSNGSAVGPPGKEVLGEASRAAARPSEPDAATSSYSNFASASAEDDVLPVMATAEETDVPSGDEDDLPPATDVTAPIPANGHQNGRSPENLTWGSAVRSASREADRSVRDDACRQGNAGAHPLLYVRCLGDFALLHGDREITPEADDGTVYKGLEVLAFLAVHPNGEITRDKLFATVWPDSTPHRARKSMHAAIIRLRAALIPRIPGLTADFLRSERGGIVLLAPTLVTSDAREFLACCKSAERLPPAEAAAALERARELYRGDLLTGRGARFDQWVDEREGDGTTLREQFRDAYDAATMRLADLHRALGRPEQAVPLYRALLKGEPTLEDAVRGLFRCYGALGNLQLLVREERRLRQALRDAYAEPNDPDDSLDDYQPEPETTALFKEIRAALENSDPRPNLAFSGRGHPK